MSKIYISYDSKKVIIGFENSHGDLEYTVYTEHDGGTADEFSKDKFIEIAEDNDIVDDVFEINS